MKYPLRSVSDGKLAGLWEFSEFTTMNDCEYPTTWGCNWHPSKGMCTHHVNVDGVTIHVSTNAGYEGKILAAWDDDENEVEGPFDSWTDAFNSLQDKYGLFTEVSDEEVQQAAERTKELLARMELK
jgi:hypothetical protein